MRRPREALALLLTAAACATGPAESATPVVVLDLDGQPHRPLEPAAGDALAHVLIFISPDCPIANAYAPEIRAVVAEHAGRPLRFFLIHADPQTARGTARLHAGEFGLPAPVLLDPEQLLTHRMGISVTPEVAIVDRDGGLVYRGRIDDRYSDLGVKRPRGPVHRDLREALAALLEGRPPPAARTVAVGCDIPDR